jgi:hypothetical protein
VTTVTLGSRLFFIRLQINLPAYLSPFHTAACSSYGEEYVLRTEMAGLESQEEDAPKRVLFYNPMRWLGQIRPHRRDESWSASLWQTFFSTSMGAQIPVIAEKPLAVCGCRKFKIDALGDHLCTCAAHSGAKKAHGQLINSLTFFVRLTE